MTRVIIVLPDDSKGAEFATRTGDDFHDDPYDKGSVRIYQDGRLAIVIERDGRIHIGGMLP